MLKLPETEDCAMTPAAPPWRAWWLVAIGLVVSSCSLNRSAPGIESDSEAAAPPVQPASRPLAAENSPEAIEILERHIAAIGGREAQKAIVTVDTEREAELFKVVRKTHEVRDTASQRFYSKTEDPNGTIEMGFDGKRVWQKSPFFRGYLPESDPNAKTLSRKRPELYEYTETAQKFVRLPAETIEGKQLVVLETRSSDFDPLGRETKVKYYFDPESFLLRRMVIGSEVTQAIDFDDYREVDGTKVPFLSIATNPNITVKSRIKQIKYNAPVDPSIFEYQPRGTPDAGLAPAPASGPQR